MMDRATDLSAFVAAVEAASFSGAARRLGVTPSAVSKAVGRLERRLNVRLFRRSTRSLAPTQEGDAFYERIRPLLAELEHAEEAVSIGGETRGALRISLPSDLGRLYLRPLTGIFLARYPDIRLEINLTDRRVDLVREGYDLALRAGEVGDIDLHIRTLGQAPMTLVAAPSLVERLGRPFDVKALMAMPQIRYVTAGRPFPITLKDGRLLTPAPGPLDCDSGVGLRSAALNGVGIAHLLRWSVADDLASGRLVEVSPSPLRPVPLQVLHAFGRHTPVRARLFIDFIEEVTIGFRSGPAITRRPDLSQQT